MDYKSTFLPFPCIRRKCVRCSLRWITFFIVFMSVVNNCHGIYRDCSSDGEPLACFPSSERILINTDTSITVEPPEATCGMNGEVNEYLMLGDLHTVYKCQNGEHSADKMIDGGTGKLATWWQSKTWTVDEYTTTSAFTIDITLSVKKKYRMSSDITLTFNSGRPQKMIIMKSADNGATWQDMQYYARKCTEEYPDAPTEMTLNLTAVICTEDYSRDTSNPQQGLQAVFPGANLRMAHLDLPEYYTEMEETAMKEFLTFTDIRIRLLYPATDSQEATLTALNFYRYYYAISNVDITGSCFCNLHSSGCVTDGTTGESRCECQHNTAGEDCERCMDLYNNKPWKEGSYLPYPDGTANPCEKCECYNHSENCTYNATYDEGVCNNCVDNTAGRKCDACLEGFYPDMALPLNHSDVCPPCNCEPLGLLNVNDTSCVNDRSAPVVGQCMCKPLVTGRRCDACVGGYYGLLDPESPGTCTDCGCNELGRSSDICHQTTGQCNCKDSIEGRICDTCKDGFFQFPVIASAECSPCRCDPGGSVNITCDNFGICTCIPHVTGPKCNLVEQHHYMRSVDEFLKQPTGGTCVIGGGAYSLTNPFDGEVFATCPKDAATVIFEELKGQEHQFEVSWSFVVGVRYTLLGSEPRSGNLHVQPNANTNIDFQLQESLCPVSFQIGEDRVLLFQPGISESVSSGTTLTLDRRCVYTVELTVFQNASDIVIDSVVFMPNLSHSETGKSFRTLSESSDPAALTSLYGTCRDKMMSMIQRPDVITPGECRDLLWSVSAEIYKQGTPCDCDATGSTSTSCASLGGKCPCKLGVGGRQCDACLPGYFGLSASGCSQCNCESSGSVNGACDLVTGQCECLPNVAINGEVDRDGISDNRQCRACASGYYGYDAGGGCTACSCSGDGAVSSQCGPDGQCPCKDTIGGLRCDQCADDFFQYTSDGCTSCGCDADGSTSSACDKNTGLCSCKENVEGDKCNACKHGFFNLAGYNPMGCQPCFCFNHGDQCSSADGFVVAKITEESTTSWNETEGRRVAPASFLGDHHNSYGRLLSWELLLAGTEGDIAHIDMAVIKGDGSSLSYRHESETGSGAQTFGVRLFPENWLLDGGNPPTPDKMYRILASIDEVSFAIEYNTRYPTLSMVAMETIQADPSVSASDGAGNVEECTCSRDFFGGLSCETCGGGRRRQDPSAADPRYGICISCNCNGKTEGDPECDEMTGVCLNCRNGTIGDNCEECAPNVIVGVCDTCVDGFWGISADGCSECNCSDVGAMPGDCEKGTGQCTCKSHVTGRQCDTCEENYHSLTETGCVVCEGCYKLVKAEAEKLRANLVITSDLIGTIQQADQNAELGPFIDRLNSATAKLGTLLRFLQTANDEEADVINHIADYTDTITELTNQLDAQNTTEVPALQQNLAETDVNLKDSRGTREQTETYITNVHDRQGPLAAIATNMEAIVASLQEIQTNMSSLTSDSSDQVTRIISTVQAIEDYARLALAKADDDQEEFQTLFDTHQNTSGHIATLENLDLTLDALSSSAFTEVQRLHAKSNATYETAVNLQATRTALGFPNYDFGDMNNTLISSQNNLATIKVTVEANTADVEAKAIIVNTAIANTTIQKMETNIIIKQCEALESRLVTAKRTVEDAKKLANDAFADAETMLDVMSNFNARATEVKEQATASLEYVNSVNTQSQGVIVDADEMLASLIAAKQASALGFERAQSAKTIIEDKNTKITGVYDQAIGLQQNTSFDLTDLEARSNQPASINATDVKPTYDRCQQQQGDITTANSVIEDAVIKVGQTERTVEFTIADAQKLLNDLNSLDEIEIARIEALQGIVPLLAPSFNEQELVSTINNLKNDLDSQTAKINALKLRKEKLETEIASLKLAQQLIV